MTLNYLLYIGHTLEFHPVRWMFSVGHLIPEILIMAHKGETFII